MPFKIYIKHQVLLLTCIFGGIEYAQSQDQPIGQWRSHFPYRNATAAATDGNKIFVAGSVSFFTYDILKNETNTYSKVNGMSDVEMSNIAHDPLSQTTILAYTNSNIDLFKNETFYNIPDLKLRSVSGDKNIYHIHIEKTLAYLSTGVGILVLNLDKQEVKETYVFTKNKTNYAVKAMVGDSLHFYAATDNGLYKTAKNNPNIQASSSWKILDSTRKYAHITFLKNKIFAVANDTVFQINNDTPAYVFAQAGTIIKRLDALDSNLSISAMNTIRGGKIFIFDKDFTIIDSTTGGIPLQCIQTLDNRIWIADNDRGLYTKNQTIIPNGPYTVGAYDILADNGKMAIAHGAYDDRWNIKNDPTGFSTFENNEWKTYNRFTNPKFGTIEDAVRMATDPSDGTLYIASQINGLFYLKTDGTAGNYREDVFDKHLIDPSTYRLSGVAFDQYNNLWVSQTNAPNELVVRAAETGIWSKFALFSTRPRPYWENGAAGLVIDDYNQKWVFSPAGGGVIVFDDKNTIENTSDDRAMKLLAGVGSGNLPDNNVQCIVNDKKGTIWIGTNNGIGIINCPDRVIDRTCEAEIRVVQYDNFAGELFAGEQVNAIAVDGANRKWVGTGNGVWLISEDANKLIYRFTKDNSPLPSNVVRSIKVDGTTGDVYFGTDKGLVSFKSTATNGGKSNNNVVIFPNPVTNNYTGTIAIKGLVNNADVRITDISGQLIYRTKALGGQAIWNGKDYTGRRPQSGVYLVFASNNSGEESFAGKMVFIK